MQPTFRRFVFLPLIAALGAVAAALPVHSQTAGHKPDYAVQPVPFKDVRITDAFWTPRLENNRTVTIPGLFARYGDRPDLRLIEAACYELAQHPDPALRALVDSKLDAQIAAIRSQKHVWSTAGDGDTLWAGNFLEASVAYYEATGSRKLLDVAIEIANDLDAEFGPDKRHDISNHEGIKMGLVKLYRCTGDEKYLKLARFFLDSRGNSTGRPALYGPYAQDQAPVVSQTRAIGHAVRATYLYIPLTDIAALTGESSYARADERIWQDALSKRTFLTGGFGTYRDKENFGDEYDLPNLSCWNEICAAYGNTLWNEKMFLMQPDAKYADMMERVLYNALLVGVSLKGDKYLYQAPLKAYGSFARSDWFGPNCCPPNVARLLPQLGSLIYAHDDRNLYVNLFVASETKVALGGTTVSLAQFGKYPWEGAVNLTVNPQKPARFAMMVRIPGWAREKAWPTDLYRQLPAAEKKVLVLVNGEPEKYVEEKGYARIEREWKSGDVINLSLPMPVQRVVATDQVADDRGMVALERGPLVYCLEQADNPGGVFNLVLADDANCDFTYRTDVLGGVGEITGTATALSRGADHVSVVKKAQTFTAIPYYAFANRAPGQMSVWLARDEAKAVIPPKATIASTSRASSSCGNGTVADNYPGHKPPTIQKRLYTNSQDGSGDINAICDQIEPVNSEDGSSPYLRLHPQDGEPAWVQYDFAKPTRVSSVEVYWKDDKQFCVLPNAWHLVYRDGETWKLVKPTGTYGVAKDKFNKVAFEPVTTTGLRMVIEMQAKEYKKGELGPPDANYLERDLTWYECGLIEWVVNP